MFWKDIINILQRFVPSGSITTYGEISAWAYGTSNYDRPVRSMLSCARNKGFHQLANRVVGFDGKLAGLADESDQQRQQLLNEGILFTIDGKVDLAKTIPVVLGKGRLSEAP